MLIPQTPDFASEIRTGVTGAVATITLDRPDVGNALTGPMMRRLAEHIRTLAERADVHVLVLAATGDVFCKGRDARGESRAGLSAYAVRQQVMGAVLGVYEAIAKAPIPVVGRVQGSAINFGLALATACDITLVSSKATLRFAEIEQGIPATMAMSAAMPNMSPKALAYLIYGAGEVDPVQAKNWGLVSEVFPDDRFDEETRVFIEALAGRARINLETIKRFQSAAAGLSADMRAEYAGTLLALVRSADSH